MVKKIKKHIETIIKLRKDFGFIFMMQCLLTRLISFKLYEKFMFRYLTKYFKPVIEKYKQWNQQEIKKVNETVHIWTLWWQGEEEAPELVKVCLESQRKMLICDGIEYHVLTKDNWNEYIQLPTFILEKVEKGYITLTHFSDIIRAELLKTYGGIWIDATVFCLKKYDFTKRETGFFTIKTQKESDYYTLERWTGFFIGDNKNSFLFSFMSDAFTYYWEKENSLIVYLLIDYIIAIAYEQFECVKNNIDTVEISNPNIWCLLKKLNTPFNEELWKDCVSETSFLKLSYKNEFNGGRLVEYAKENEKTFWGVIKIRNK